MSLVDLEPGVLREWLAVLRAPGIGPIRFAALLEQATAPEELFALAQAGTDLPEPARAALKHPDWTAIDADLAWAVQGDNRILSLLSPDYPALLREIPDPPPLLFVHGNVARLMDIQVAMVGSRNPTPGGRDTAEAFARHLAATGLTITSGLALGIDTVSHQGSLAVGGLTVAVMGTGLDRVYPARNRELAHNIVAAGGALVSEFPTGTPPQPENFPRRNRIISGLSLGTLVVEAAVRSGSLTTARHAVEQGREVFAIPGSIHNPLARGCHALIRQGAKLVETAEDILEELHFVATTPPESRPSVTTAPAGLSADQKQLLDLMGFDDISVDQLAARSGLTAAAVSSMLLILELDGRVTSRAGGRYVRSETRG
ncbi:MAG TPA: DNA-processing protein DprA [Gammaproteobacteria bacterium]